FVQGFPALVDAESGKAISRILDLRNYFVSPDLIVGVDYGAATVGVREYDGMSGKVLRSTTFASEAGGGSVAHVVKDGKEVLITMRKSKQLRVGDLSSQKVSREFALAEVQSEFWLAITPSADGSWIAIDQQVFNGANGAL